MGIGWILSIVFTILIFGTLGLSQNAYGQVPSLDSDGDGILDFIEDIIGTQKHNPDTDNDGLLDGEEISIQNIGNFFIDNPLCVVFPASCIDLFENFINNNFIFRTDPNNPDTDSDGFSDGDEVKKFGTNTLDVNDFPPDTDLDSLLDFDEMQIGTDPNNRDTDNDGLKDGDEINTFGTDPVNKDTDEDGISDGDEVALGFNSINPQDPFPPITPKTGFDWTMPNRFGFDDDKDGKIDYFTTFDSIHPPNWQVDFDACDLLNVDPISTYEWTVLNKVFVESTCDGFSFDFPNEGSFMVTLTASNTQGESISFTQGEGTSFTQKVVVQDWLVVSFGDSFGSGEGAPDISVDGELISMKINNLKLAKDPFEQELFNANQQKDALVAQLVTLQGQLGAALKEASEIDFVTTTLCLGLQGTIEYTTSEKNRLTNLINNENSKNFWNRDFISLGIWETERAAVQLALSEAQSSFNSNNCAAVLQKVNDFNTTVKNLKDQIIDTERQIAALVAKITNLLSKISQILNDIDALITLYNQTPPQWQSEPDHRSANSGHAKASLWLEEFDPRTSVTFVHMAKSGDISIGIPDQIKNANDIIGNREIDAVILSIGGNDVLFSPLIVKCLVHEPCNLRGFANEDFADVCDDFIPLGFDDECVAQLQSFVDEARTQMVNALKEVLPGNPSTEDVEKLWDTIDSETLFFLAIYGPMIDIMLNGNGLPVIDPITGRPVLEIREDSDGIPVPCTSQTGRPGENRPFPLCNSLLLRLQALAKGPDNVSAPPGSNIVLPDGGFPNLAGLVPNNQNTPRLDRIFHVEYVDETKDDVEEYCDPKTNPLSPSFLSKDEHEWLDKTMEITLNQVLEDSATDIGWNFVGGVYDGFRSHGLCAQDSWVVGSEESLLVQKDPFGTAHPNKKGYAHYGLQILQELRQDLYKNGDPNFPREPDVIVGIPPESPNTSTSKGIVESFELIPEPIAIGKPSGISTPFGFWNFKINNVPEGDESILTLTFNDPVPIGGEFWKIIDGEWMDATSILGDDDGDNVLTLTLVDGGPFDADKLANGMISDPGVLVFRLSTPVGGEMIPVDSTSLLVAGTQMNAAWMIPVIVSAIGIAIVLARKF